MYPRLIRSALIFVQRQEGDLTPAQLAVHATIILVGLAILNFWTIVGLLGAIVPVVKLEFDGWITPTRAIGLILLLFVLHFPAIKRIAQDRMSPNEKSNSGTSRWILLYGVASFVVWMISMLVLLLTNMP